jgi:hypothetical protein
MNRARILRLLRIAVSVVCLIVCGLFIVLWVRSYGSLDMLHGRIWHGRELRLESQHGQVSAYIGPLSTPSWRIRTYSTDGGLMLGMHDLWLNKSVSQFSVFTVRQGLAITVPHWFVILLCVALASLPWIASPYRFSLRTLLIATMLVAIVLGLVVAFQ